MAQDIAYVVKSIVAKEKCMDLSGIGMESKLDDLGVTSLEAITIVYDIEENFDIEVPSELLLAQRTVGDIVDGVTALIAAKS